MSLYHASDLTNAALISPINSAYITIPFRCFYNEKWNCLNYYIQPEDRDCYPPSSLLTIPH